MLFRKARLTVPAILFLVLLRLAIGWHFFQEGAVKVRDGFTSTPFLAGAKGPFAKHFHAMIPDYDGAIRIDAKRMSDAAESYGEQIKREFALSEDQSKDVDSILADFKAKRKEIYDEWKPQIEEYKNGVERLDKLDNDPSRSKVASLRGQREEIESKWRALGKPVLAEIDNSVSELVKKLNAVASDEQANPDPKKPLAKDADGNLIRKKVEFKYEGEGPISDMSVGILLLLGLLTPLAGLAAGIFLASVVVSQFPGFPGTQPTYYQAIEMLGCFVVAFADAGRYAGLDFIPWSFWNRKSKVPTV